MIVSVVVIISQRGNQWTYFFSYNNLQLCKTIVNAGPQAAERKQQWCAQSASKWISILRISAARIVSRRPGGFISWSISHGRSRPRKKIRGLSGPVLWGLVSSLRKERSLSISLSRIITSLRSLKSSRSLNCKISSRPKVLRRSLRWGRWHCWQDKP